MGLSCASTPLNTAHFMAQLTRLVALIDHPELTQFSSFPKSPIFMQFKSYFIQFSSKG